ncbi:MAG: hypothetical protein GXN96_06080 [Aquificae bacterium]|nr:hypothetical protein [Aquificota bacterium]
MIFTGVDGEKTYSVSYSILKKSWRPTTRKGRRIYVIPSDLCLVKKEIAEVPKPSELAKLLSFEAEEYGATLWDFSGGRDFYYVVFVKEFREPEDAYALDCEVFSLARVARVLGEEELFILDLGRRKTTLVRVEGGELSFYRVVLRGGEYITRQLAKERGIPEERAEEIKLKEGLGNEVVRRTFGEILTDLGVKLERERVLLSGGGARLKGIEEFFGEVLFNPHAEPELVPAFGAALKFIYRDHSPTFRKEELSPREQRALILLTGLATFAFLVSSLGQDYLKKEVVRFFNDRKKELFREKFPQLPPVMVEEQLRSMTTRESEGPLQLLDRAFSGLPQGVKVYRITYRGNTLRIVGEVEENLVDRLKAERLKKTPQGTYEFEVILR